MGKIVIITAILIFGILANPVFVKAQELSEDELFQGLQPFIQFDKNKAKRNRHKKDKVSKTYLKLTKTGKKFPNGLFELKLEYVKNGQSKEFILVNSGVPSSQFFRTGEDSQRGSFEPLPEGRWYIYDILWKGGKNSYKRNWGEGLGPVKIPLDYVSPGKTERGAILFHLDWNAEYSPGTAGCIGVRSVADFKRLVKWLRDTDPRNLYVDWGLGSVKLPD